MATVIAETDGACSLMNLEIDHDEWYDNHVLEKGKPVGKAGAVVEHRDVGSTEFIPGPCTVLLCEFAAWAVCHICARTVDF